MQVFAPKSRYITHMPERALKSKTTPAENWEIEKILQSKTKGAGNKKIEIIQRVTLSELFWLVIKIFTHLI